MFKKALSVILAATLCMGCMMVNAISVEKPATEEPYYSETVYYTGEDLSKVKAVKSENPGESLVGVIEKTVYVSETTDKTGNVVDSHLMTKSEVEEYREGLSNITPRDSTLIGQDNTKEEALTISLSVFRQSDNTYKAYGSAKWASSGGSTEGKPAVGKDYIAITWGGGGDLVQKSKQIAGTYYNGKSVTFSQAKADSYKGYCWQFI